MQAEKFIERRIEKHRSEGITECVHRLSRETLRQDAVCSGWHSTATLQKGRRGTSWLSYQLQGIALPRGDVYEQWRDPVVSLPRWRGRLRELVKLAEIQKEEQKVLVEHTLVGAMRSLNSLNDERAMAALQRLSSLPREKETRREKGERSQSSGRLLPWRTVSSHQLYRPLKCMWMHWTRTKTATILTETG